MTHERTQCDEVRATTHYSGKSYSVQFECPFCQRKGRFNLSFLGRRRVVCNGIKFEKVDKWLWESELDQQKEALQAELNAAAKRCHLNPSH